MSPNLPWSPVHLASPGVLGPPALGKASPYARFIVGYTNASKELEPQSEERLLPGENIPSLVLGFIVVLWVVIIGASLAVFWFVLYQGNEIDAPAPSETTLVEAIQAFMNVRAIGVTSNITRRTTSAFSSSATSGSTGTVSSGALGITASTPQTEIKTSTNAPPTTDDNEKESPRDLTSSKESEQTFTTPLSQLTSPDTEHTSSLAIARVTETEKMITTVTTMTKETVAEDKQTFKETPQKDKTGSATELMRSTEEAAEVTKLVPDTSLSSEAVRDKKSTAFPKTTAVEETPVGDKPRSTETSEVGSIVGVTELPKSTKQVLKVTNILPLTNGRSESVRDERGTIPGNPVVVTQSATKGRVTSAEQPKTTAAGASEEASATTTKGSWTTTTVSSRSDSVTNDYILNIQRLIQLDHE